MPLTLEVIHKILDNLLKCRQFYCRCHNVRATELGDVSCVASQPDLQAAELHMTAAIQPRTLIEAFLTCSNSIRLDSPTMALL
jgi:hypothetical protein